jgi:hypothetical protein
MVLNALAIDPRRTWKGAWRWFHEALLDCCLPLEQVQQDGIVLAQVSRAPQLLPGQLGARGGRQERWRWRWRWRRIGG